MAKPKSGLGRSFASLLNGAVGEGLSTDKAAPIERVVAEPAPDVPAPEPAPSPAPAPKPVPASEPAVQPVASKAPEESEPKKEAPAAVDKADNIYVSLEDNITIKEVHERPASGTYVQPARKTDQPKDEKSSEEIAIELIEPNPNQPRTNFKKEDLEELAESIKRNGLLQPILVRRLEGGTYQIIAGERRWQACKQLGLKTVPAHVRDAGDDEAIMLALVENIQRSDLNPIEEAYGYRRMMERGAMTQAEVAQAVSKGRSTIANALRLLELPEDAQQLLFEEKITAGHARAILSIPDREGRRKLTDKLVQEQLSVRETEAIARLLSGKKESDKAPKAPAPKSYKTVARSLSDVLKTPVKIRSANGKNRIEIEFRDEVDLERLFRLMAAEKRS